MEYSTGDIELRQCLGTFIVLERPGDETDDIQGQTNTILS